MRKAYPRKKSQGTKRMKEQGYLQSQLWLDAAEAQLLRDAADKVGKRLATYIRERAVHAALTEMGFSLDQWYRNR